MSHVGARHPPPDKVTEIKPGRCRPPIQASSDHSRCIDWQDVIHLVLAHPARHCCACPRLVISSEPRFSPTGCVPLQTDRAWQATPGSAITTSSVRLNRPWLRRQRVFALKTHFAESCHGVPSGQTLGTGSRIFLTPPPISTCDRTNVTHAAMVTISTASPVRHARILVCEMDEATFKMSDSAVLIPKNGLVCGHMHTRRRPTARLNVG